MLLLASTSLGLFLRATTHSVQKRPLNHSANVSTSSACGGSFFFADSSFSGGFARLACAANTAVIARCSASSAPTLVAERSWYGPGEPGVPYSRRFFPSGVFTDTRKNQAPVLASRRTGIVTALPWRSAVTTNPTIA
jgi:hypothetical protein